MGGIFSKGLTLLTTLLIIITAISPLLPCLLSRVLSSNPLTHNVTNMSVKFKETVQTNIRDATNAPGSIAHEIGAAVTRGGGPQGYLAVSGRCRFSLSDVIKH